MPFAFFLDRSDGRTASFAGSRPSAALAIDALGRVREHRGGRWRALEEKPVEAIARFVRKSAAIPLEPPPDRFGACTLPRTVGFLGYELGRWIERVPVPTRDTLGLPIALLCTYDHVYGLAAGTNTPVRFDFVPADENSDALGHIDARGYTDTHPDANPGGTNAAEATVHYHKGFVRIKEAIAAGDVYQVNLSRRISIEQTEPSEAVYARMRDAQPVPHGTFFDAGEFQILSNSPETFLDIKGDTIHTFPIKGTRPRGADPSTDARLARELVGDPKENAEHVMIVDLERNDLGRVCVTGSVEVPVFAEVHSFQTIHHMVSEVRGRLRPGAGLADVLRATFPGGSITGAPKIKSMEIIATVEADARGVYTGCVGCFNGERDVDLSVAIRTAVAMNGALHYNTGGGIVADSTLEAEYAETVAKSDVFRRALQDTGGGVS